MLTGKLEEEIYSREHLIYMGVVKRVLLLILGKVGGVGKIKDLMECVVTKMSTTMMIRQYKNDAMLLVVNISSF